MFITWETIVSLLVIILTLPLWLPLVAMILGSLTLFLAYIALNVMMALEDVVNYIRNWRNKV